ncbi:hypothetical protein PPTG_13633 [Phytophthora nicotianae INRA-310]|uniref:Uncharacterized protein n=1 Tax=Phytophthora nicotianae (strain INRA-310) TaxID=761204 RepID=W2Q3C9_PHYN3|nr:hypothetical protein PPTG_13633 [Phytophthora nicotianae INRA-310]ETN07341.1 hypothetical protein PPTG_13633 [Phytophthora nicotianae INRA-310]
MPAPLGKPVLRARDLSFRSVWKELKANGWTSKKAPSRSLDNRYRYIRPGADPNGTEGVDFFLGPDAVLDFYIQAVKVTSTAPETGGVNERERDADAATQPPATSDADEERHGVPTTPQRLPSPKRIGAAETASSTPVPDSPRTTSSRERHQQQRSPGSRPPSSRRLLIATSPHTASSACDDTGDDLAADGDESIDWTGDSDEDDDAQEGPEADVMLDKDDDLNYTAPDENAAQYGAMDSGDEAALDDLDTGEDGEIIPDVLDVDEDTYAPEATELEIANEIQFAEQFLENIGSEEAVLAGNLQDTLLREMSTSGWEDIEQPSTYNYMQSPYEPVDNKSSYPGLRQGYSGASPDALRCGDSPIALFFHFMPVPLWQHIAVCSNEYRNEMVPQCVEEAQKRYKKKRRANPSLPMKTRREIQHELETEKAILPQ